MPQIDLSLRDYLRIFRKRKFIIVAIFLAVTITTRLYYAAQPEVFEASTTVKILERQSVAGLLTEWIVYSPADVMESQAKAIKGFPVMKKVALQLGLIDEHTPVPIVHSVVTDLQGQVETQTIKLTNVIAIIASADNAKEAMTLANVVAQVYVEENLMEKRRQASAARKFIEEQLAHLEARLKEGEERLREFNEEVKEIKLAETMEKQLLDLEFKLASLLQRYTEKHPQVIQLREQIRDLEGQVEGFSGQDLDYARLIRETEVNKKLYGILKERLEEARITEAQKIGDISIVDPAVLPRSPVSPQKGIGTLVGAIMGAILGIGLAFMLETLDTSIGTIEDVEELLKVPVLGIVPSIPSYLEREKGILGRLLKGIYRGQKKEAEEIYIRLFVHYKPRSPIAEAYRNLRTNLKVSSSQRAFLVTSSGPREGKSTILINLGLTAAQKGAKTLLVSSDLRRPALAKTFNIDKEPGLNEVISGTVKLEDALRNISDIMLGGMQLEEVVQTPSMENIWLLPSGRVPFNPAELLESKNLPKLVEELRRKFDVIFFDSPPVLPVTDASLLAPKVDSVILCYEIGRTAKDALLRTKLQLESTGAKILGVVLNHIAPRTEIMAPYPYYYRYKYYGRERTGKDTAEGRSKEEPFSEDET